MASLKIVLCIVLFSATTLGHVMGPRREHNIDLCEKAPDGNQWTQFVSTVAQVHGKFLQIVKQEIKWPVGSEEPAIIKCIRVTELLGDGTGGYATIHEGGLNYTHVTIHLESQRSHNLLFRVTVLGEPSYPKPTPTY